VPLGALRYSSGLGASTSAPSGLIAYEWRSDPHDFDRNPRCLIQAVWDCYFDSWIINETSSGSKLSFSVTTLSCLHRPPVPPHVSAGVEWTTPPSVKLAGTSLKGAFGETVPSFVPTTKPD
jgi:hypothetical protein